MTTRRDAARPPIVTRQPRFRLGFFNDVIGELRKVVWPSREEATRLTVMVLIVATAVGVALGAIDIGFSALIRWII